MGGGRGGRNRPLGIPIPHSPYTNDGDSQCRRHGMASATTEPSDATTAHTRSLFDPVVMGLTIALNPVSRLASGPALNAEYERGNERLRCPPLP